MDRTGALFSAAAQALGEVLLFGLSADRRRASGGAILLSPVYPVGGYDAPNGFATGKTKSTAQAYANKIDRLEEFGKRFRDVILENLDWSAVLEKYDSPETVFYLDPPYVGAESTYPVGQINHEALLDALRELEGTAICSYEDLPANAEGLHVVERSGEKRFINNGKQGEAKDATERLLLNFAPKKVEDVIS